ncbi:MAG TPA: hypothetical protein VER58_16285 [Thermoanaerobaculia bacterium]|nr:hypothetical protein [Thermoanaerobaculia bacterium]
MRKKTDYSKFVWSLPDKPRLEYFNITRDRLADIAARVANFEPPYEYLKNVRAGFDSAIRFMLDRCLEGEKLACAARDMFVVQQRNWFRPSALASSSDDPWREFFTAHEGDYPAYIKRYYPWRYPGGISGPDAIKPDPNLDDYFNAAVLDNLGAYGFRRLSRSFKSEVLSRPLVIKWEKGQLSMTMLVSLEVPTLAHSERIGFPFAFSAGTFDHSMVSNVEKQFHSFFGEYGKIFPDVLSALDQGIRAQEAWLTRTAKRGRGTP